MQGKNALIIVDVQNDFCLGGRLGAADSDAVIPIINHLRKNVPFDFIYLTSDWHPADHVSFASNHAGKKPFDTLTLSNGKVQELWPDHCVQNQAGSYFHKNLLTASTDIIIRKGVISDVDSYSGFGSPPEDTGLEKNLKSRGVQRLFVVGIALDFCVKSTAIDGAAKGFSTFLVEDGVATIEREKRKEVLDFIAYNGIQQTPILKLEVVSLENMDCELEDDDIRAVFENFGTIAEVKVKADGKAFITFNDILDAYFAQAYLNDREIDEDKIKLKVDWCTPADICENGLKVPKREVPEDPKGLFNGGADLDLQFPSLTNIKNDDLGVPSNNKLTCRFNIQIENEKDFQVARRIIGPKGCHMKRIIDACIKEAPKEITNTSDLIKLRLRGKGSGYKEGADKQESQEPLHLCLSSAHNATYLFACKLVEDHLNNIYEEFKKHCSAYGRHYDPNLTIKKIECSNIKTLLETTKLPAPAININPLPSNNINHSLTNFPVMSPKPLEEEFQKMKIERPPSGFSEGQETSAQSKDYSTFPKKPVNSEPFYPVFSKPPGIQGFNSEQAFFQPQNPKPLLPSSKNQKMMPPGNPNTMNPQNNFQPFNPIQPSYISYGSSLPLNNLYQPNPNPPSLSAILKELNITEEEIRKLIEDRNKARREQNFLEADRIRNYLKAKGIALMDEKGGRGKGAEVTTWKVCKLNYSNQKNGEFYSFNNGNSYYNDEPNNSMGFNGKFLKYNP